MVQLMEEVPRDRMFHESYPYVSSGSAVMREHFQAIAKRFLATELTGPDPFVVELGSNDGTMLQVIAESGIRHLGVEPSGGVADLAAAKGIRVRKDFFEEATATDILAADGPADVIYAANTLCHIPYMESILRGVDRLLAPGGVFVFEDPYFADILERTSFDQIYDEHFFFFTARSVQEMARRFGFELVDVERLSVHGGEVRYTLSRPGAQAGEPGGDRPAGRGERGPDHRAGDARGLRLPGRGHPRAAAGAAARAARAGGAGRRLRRHGQERDGDELLRHRPRAGPLRL